MSGNDAHAVADELKGVLRQIQEEQAARRRLKSEFTNFEDEVVALLESSPAMYLLIDGDCRIRKANRAAIDRWSTEAEDLIGQSFFSVIGCRDQSCSAGGCQQVFCGADGDRFRDLVANAIETTGTTEAIRQRRQPVTLALPTREGNAGFDDYLVTVVPYRVEGRSHALIVMEDLSKLQQLAVARARDRHIHSLAILASTVANEGNNVVQMVLGQVALARFHLSEDSPVKAMLSIIEQAALRWSDLGAVLTGLADEGHEETQLSAVEAERLIERAIERARQYNPTVEIALRQGTKDVPAIAGHGALFGRCLDALLDNAIDAARETGTTVSCAIDTAHVAEGATPPLSGGDYVTIAITDHGAGMSPDVVERAFDPLFSTKPGARGLGLPAAYSIARRYQGAIFLSSASGNGTTVSLYLPQYTEAMLNDETAAKKADMRPTTGAGERATKAARQGLAVTTAPGDRGRVLLMDDEEIIRAVASEMLTLIGYRVTAVENGYEAVKAYQDALSSEAPYRAVILDLAVPASLGGRETVRQLLAIDPDVQVVVSSGLRDDPVIIRYKEFGFAATLPKPYSLEDLQQVLEGLGD